MEFLQWLHQMGRSNQLYNHLKHESMKSIFLFQQSARVFLFILIAGISISSFAAFKVSGKIVDTSKQPLASVLVQVKGTQITRVSDANGIYSIEVPNAQSSVLVFSLNGYKTKSLKVNNRSTLHVQLEMELVVVEDRMEMEEQTKMAVADHYISRKCISAAAPQGYATSQTYYNPSVETYSKVNKTGFKGSKLSPLSTFSIDVDRASYSNIRRFLNNGQTPPADAVRIEEMINYFEYDYQQPKDEHPFSIYAAYSECPWQREHKLLHIGIQGKKIDASELPASNLVFLIDVSGSMEAPNKLLLLKSAFKLLVNNLRPNDRVAIVVYAGAAGIVLPSTPGNNKQAILDALDRLQAGGSTAGAAGIQLAYKVAVDNFIKGGNNRVILATDGDFNVGVSNENELERLITEKRNTGVYLTCLGFGMGNYKDSKMEILADKGNGNYGYINDMQEANKTLVSEFGGTLFTIAKDVKIQVEFNSAIVQGYRLVGYENRMLNTEDFKDDTKDAGELGAGHTVTALYEIIPVGVSTPLLTEPDGLRYQQTLPSVLPSQLPEVATVKFRYKKPDGDRSIEMVHPIPNKPVAIEKAPENLRFASSVAMFGMLLRNSEYKGSATYNEVLNLATTSTRFDPDGYRAEFIRLVKNADKNAPKAE